jgi:DNA-binding response OmpR family regulator
MRVLLAEDDEKVAAEVSSGLSEAGFVVRREREGERAREIAGSEDFAAIILDLGLPDCDGLTVLKRLRAEGRRTPVLLLTARGSWMEKVEGIEAGADDYLAKPFHMEELIARTRALIRRAVGAPTTTLAAGELAIDPKLKRATVNGRGIALTANEFRALHYLVANKGRIVSPDELKDHVHGGDIVTTNALEALIGRLRRKLGSNAIKTRRGFGYIVPDEP